MLFLSVCGFALPLLLFMWLRKPADPPKERTVQRWIELLRTSDPAARAAAVFDLSLVDTVPTLPCALLVDRLSDIERVRTAAVAVLSRVTAQGRCISAVAAVLRDSASWRTRTAAAQALGGGGHVTAPVAAPVLLRSLADSRVADAAAVALGRIADSSSAVRDALAAAAASANGETLGDMMKALATLQLSADRLWPIVDRALADADPRVRSAAVIEAAVLTANEHPPAHANEHLLRMLHDPDADVREAARRVIR
jgi:HEAT repeat protein